MRRLAAWSLGAALAVVALLGTSVPAGALAPWDIIGGQLLQFSTTRCSLAFNAHDTSGNRYVLTSGACASRGGTASGRGGPIGPVVGWSFPGNDYGIVRVTSTDARSTYYVDRYTAGPDVIVSRAGSPGTGRVCMSGAVGGWRCGTVTGLNVTVALPNGVITGLIRTSICAMPGDTGGALVTDPGTGIRVSALGILSGATTGGPCSSYFQPIGEVLTTYGVSLYTG